MILITGSTGTFGSAVLKKLSDKGIATKTTTRDILDWEKPETFKDALQGAEKVFLVSPPNYENFDQKIIQFMEAAKEVKVKFILFSTVYGIDQNPESSLGKAENTIINSGINYTILRPNFIFQNFINYDIEAIKNGSIYLPTESSKTSYIDVNDVATASTVILENSENHYGKAYTLTGSEALSHEQFAKIFSEVLNKKIVNIAPTNEEYKTTLTNYNLPQELVDFMGYLYAAIAAGYFSGTTNDYKNITGKNPISAREFIELNRSIFSN